MFILKELIPHFLAFRNKTMFFPPFFRKVLKWHCSCSSPSKKVHFLLSYIEETLTYHFCCSGISIVSHNLHNRAAAARPGSIRNS